MTERELEYLVQKARREPVPLSRLSPSGASAIGQVIEWDGEKWVPGSVTLEELGIELEDLDGQLVIDVDGDPLTEPGTPATVILAKFVVMYHVQTEPARVWSIYHGLGRRPINVLVETETGEPTFPAIRNPSLWTHELKFAYPRAGRAVLTFHVNEQSNPSPIVN